MARRVATARSAALALEGVRRWLFQPGSGPSGLARWEALNDTRHALAEHPYLGMTNPQQPGTRQVIIAEHRIVYRISPDTGDETTAGNILILQIFGPGQK